jgi:hypothetical protein
MLPALATSLLKPDNNCQLATNESAAVNLQSASSPLPSNTHLTFSLGFPPGIGPRSIGRQPITWVNSEPTRRAAKELI